MTSMSMASYRLNDMLVSTMLARRENELHARQDSLTGLLNRHGLFGALDIAVRNAGHGQAEYAVLYLDLDGFKAVNDTYGHAAGDTLLTQVSARLVALKPADAVAARIGGDEFVLLAGRLSEAEARELGERIIASVSLPYDLDQDKPVSIGGSVGIALIPRHGADRPRCCTRPTGPCTWRSRPARAARRWPSPDAGRPPNQDTAAAMRNGKPLAPRALSVSRWAPMAQAGPPAPSAIPARASPALKIRSAARRPVGGQARNRWLAAAW